ncbi:MAG: sigma-70 family RNA polymerase sigma factor [Acidimicrobiales bacterium]
MDDASFEQWCAAVWPRLVRVVAPWVERPGDGEDIAQEALCRAIVAYDRTGELPAVTWVTTVALNVARSRLRRVRVERRHADRDRARDEVAALDGPDTGPDADAVVAALRALPERQRRAVALRYLADLSVDDAAVAMGCAPATVKAHVRDAFATLRRSGLLRDLELEGSADGAR